MASLAKPLIHIFYKVKDDEYRVYIKWTNEIKTVSKNQLYEIKNKYELMAGYNIDKNMDINLRMFYEDFMMWNNELYQNGIDSFTHSYNNDLAVLRAFTKHSTFNLFNEEHIEELETFYFESCNNGYLESCVPGEYDSYGYDMNTFYPRILAENNLKIPVKAGKEYKLEALDKYNLKYGFYKVVITCYHPEFIKIFKFAENNVYTHYSLIFAFMYQSEYNIKIELNKDENFNAYLYNDSDLIETKSIFGDWFKKLIILKNKFPQNKLVKHLLSSLWGSLSRKNYKGKITVTEEELENYDENIYIIDDIDIEKNIYYLVKKQNKYRYNIRLKPFLQSYQRSFMGKIAHDNHLPEVIRICCDCIVYKSNVEINVKNFLPEQKSTGKILWKNARVYEQKTTFPAPFLYSENI